MSPPSRVPSPLHAAAMETFPHAALHGLTTFAPPSVARLVDLLDGRSGILVAINAEKIARVDPVIAQLASCHVGYPDGIGAVLALRRRGIRARRMAGADLWLRVIRRYAAERSFYLVGGTDEVIEKVARKLIQRHPGLRLRARSGFLSVDDEEQIERDLRDSRPDFVLVAMGSPRQELLMQRLYAIHPAVYVGLGGSFDVFAGIKRRAPRWVQEIGLEWAYRLVREPARLRRLPTYLRFVTLLGTGRY